MYSHFERQDLIPLVALLLSRLFDFLLLHTVIQKLEFDQASKAFRQRHIMALVQAPKSLLDLPCELRMRIYKFVFAGAVLEYWPLDPDP
jgi:hypothetical protein